MTSNNTFLALEIVLKMIQLSGDNFVDEDLLSQISVGAWGLEV